MIASRQVMAVLMTTALAGTACGGGDSKSAQPAAGGSAATARPAVAVDKNAYPVFPNADAGADPAVPAEQGGKGFTGEGWETNTDFDLIGDPRAVKGGMLRQAMMTDFPSTLRYAGPNVTAWNRCCTAWSTRRLLGCIRRRSSTFRRWPRTGRFPQTRRPSASGSIPTRAGPTAAGDGR